jgi:hypothetical protein
MRMDTHTRGGPRRRRPAAASPATNITFNPAANQFGVWPTTISEFERGIRTHDDLAQTYRDWLAAA